MSAPPARLIGAFALVVWTFLTSSAQAQPFSDQPLSIDTPGTLHLVREQPSDETRGPSLLIRAVTEPGHHEWIAGILFLDGATLANVEYREEELSSSDDLITSVAEMNIADRGLEGDPFSALEPGGADLVRAIQGGRSLTFGFHLEGEVSDEIRVELNLGDNIGSAEATLFLLTEESLEGWPASDTIAIQIGHATEDQAPDDGVYAAHSSVRMRLTREDLDIEPWFIHFPSAEPGETTADALFSFYSCGVTDSGLILDPDGDDPVDRNGSLLVPCTQDLSAVIAQRAPLRGPGGAEIPIESQQLSALGPELLRGERALATISLDLPEGLPRGFYQGNLTLFEDNDGDGLFGADDVGDEVFLEIYVDGEDPELDGIELVDQDPDDFGEGVEGLDGEDIGDPSDLFDGGDTADGGDGSEDGDAADSGDGTSPGDTSDSEGVDGLDFDRDFPFSDIPDDQGDTENDGEGGLDDDELKEIRGKLRGGESCVCSSTRRSDLSGPRWLVLLPLVLLWRLRRRRRLPLVLLVATLLPLGLSANDVHAQEGLDISRTQRLGSGSDRPAVVDYGRTLAHLELGWSLNSYYARDPLIFFENDAKVRSVIQDRLDTELSASLGLYEHFELGLSLPWVLYQQGDGLSQTPSTLALGDPGLGLRWSPDLSEHLRVAALASLWLPMGSPESLSGAGHLRADLGGLVAYAFGDLTFALNLSMRAQSESVEVENLDQSHELRWAAGLSYAPLDDWRFAGELWGATPLTAPFQDPNTLPLEGLLSAQWFLPGDQLYLAASTGTSLVPGYGVPSWRLGLSVGHVPLFAEHSPEPIPVPPPKDQDRDEIFDHLDACPVDPEDFDGFQDQDGCPELDNDGDKINDYFDRAPNLREDLDGFQDRDGVPDLDNDLDGIPDDQDACPNEPEDRDGAKDADGCPDPDNDLDGVLDWEDACPLKAGRESRQGCP